MTRDSEAARNETVDAIKCEPTPGQSLFKIAFAYRFAQHLLVIGIYIRSLTLLPSTHRESNGLANICASSSSIEDVLSDVYDVTPKSSISQTLRLLNQNSLTEVKVVSSCNIGPWGWLCGEIGGESSAIFCDFRYPANGERMHYDSLAFKSTHR